MYMFIIDDSIKERNNKDAEHTFGDLDESDWTTLNGWKTSTTHECIFLGREASKAYLDYQRLIRRGFFKKMIYFVLALGFAPFRADRESKAHTQGRSGWVGAWAGVNRSK